MMPDSMDTVNVTAMVPNHTYGTYVCNHMIYSSGHVQQGYMFVWSYSRRANVYNFGPPSDRET